RVITRRRVARRGPEVAVVARGVSGGVVVLVVPRHRMDREPQRTPARSPEIGELERGAVLVLLIAERRYGGGVQRRDKCGGGTLLAFGGGRSRRVPAGDVAGNHEPGRRSSSKRARSGGQNEQGRGDSQDPLPTCSHPLIRLEKCNGPGATTVS